MANFPFVNSPGQEIEYGVRESAVSAMFSNQALRRPCGNQVQHGDENFRFASDLRLAQDGMQAANLMSVAPSLAQMSGGGTVGAIIRPTLN